MALEFRDWGLTPEQKVASRKAALDSYTNVAQPMEKERQGMEKGKLASDVYAASAKAAKQGEPQQISDVLAQAQLKAADLIPQQQQRAQNLAYQGAMYKEDILGSKQQAAVQNYNRDTEEYKDKMATELAKRSFEMGYNSKELALSMNGALADRGLAMMYQDLQAGRLTTQEIQNMQRQLKYDQQMLTNEIQKELQTLKGNLQTDLANMNIEAAKKRIERLIELQKEAAQKAAKTAMMGTLISAAGGLLGGGIAAFSTGFNPLAIISGAKYGSAAADTLTAATN